MKYINCFILLACLINYFVVIVWLQSLQPHVPTPTAAAPHPLAVSPREDPHPALHLSTCPASCLFDDKPRNWCPNHLYLSAAILAPIIWVCSPVPIPCLLVEFCSWPSLHCAPVLRWGLPHWLCPPRGAAVCSGSQESWLCAAAPACSHTGGTHWCRAACSHTSEKSPCMHGKHCPAFCLILLLKWLLHHCLGNP